MSLANFHANWNKIKRYAGMSFGRPAVAYGDYYNRKIRNYIKSGYKSTRDIPRTALKRAAQSNLGKRRRRYVGKRGKLRRMKGRKFRKSMLYQSVLKHGLTQPCIEVSSGSGNISAVQDNLQAFCNWYGFAMETTPGDWDRILSASQNLAIANVSIVQQVFLDKVRQTLTFRNNANQCANIQVYKCTPRIDIPLDLFCTGLNPTLLTEGFTGVAQEAKSSSKPGVYDYNSTPFMSSEWCSVFKVKPLTKRCLEPGQELKLNRKKSVGYVIKKSKYAISAAQSFAGQYAHMRRNGPIYLVKVWGSMTHDQSLIAYPLTSGTGTKVTTGGFSVDWILDSHWSYRAPFVTPTRVQGTYNKLPTSTLRANSDQYLENAPQETAIAV